MKRIIIHWTGGAYAANATDRKHYHFIVEGTGRVVKGNYAPDDNLSTSTPYAAHTRGLNTGSIGVAFAAMFAAKERPFDAGKYPIMQKQVDAMVKLVADLCDEYGIPVTPEAVLTHAEVEGNLGIKQRAKWDVNWLPGMDYPGHPSATGDLLRVKIKAAMKPTDTNPFAALIAFIRGLFK